MLALPVSVLERKRSEADLSTIADLVKRYQAESVVVGMPLTLRGEKGQQAQLVQAFSDLLAKALQVPVVTWDERFSTVDAQHLLIEAGLGQRKRRKRIDASAAAVILQGYLDRLRSGDV